MNEVDDDVHVDIALRGNSFHGVDLGLVAVDEYHPGPFVARVAALGFVECRTDHGRDVLDERSGQPFALSPRLTPITTTIVTAATILTAATAATAAFQDRDRDHGFDPETQDPQQPPRRPGRAAVGGEVASNVHR
jgi:hypothetical protein